jgi:hypothetical protein
VARFWKLLDQYRLRRDEIKLADEEVATIARALLNASSASPDVLARAIAGVAECSPTSSRTALAMPPQREMPANFARHRHRRADGLSRSCG